MYIGCAFEKRMGLTPSPLLLVQGHIPIYIIRLLLLMRHMLHMSAMWFGVASRMNTKKTCV